jgi:hypothetical protein
MHCSFVAFMEALCFHFKMDGLNNHNSIIDNDTNSQNQREYKL